MNYQASAALEQEEPRKRVKRQKGTAGQRYRRSDCKGTNYHVTGRESTMIKNLHKVAVLVVSAGTAMAAARSDGPSSFRGKPLVLGMSPDLFFSKDKAVREGARKDLFKQKAGLVSQLSEFIRANSHDRKNCDAVVEAIDLLGDLHASDAIDPLVDHIAYPFVLYPEVVDSGATGFQRVGKPLREDLPAIRALIKIGRQGMMPITRKLATTDNRWEFNACEDALQGIESRLGVPIYVALDWAYKNAIDDNRRAELEGTRQKFGLPPKPVVSK